MQKMNGLLRTYLRLRDGLRQDQQQISEGQDVAWPRWCGGAVEMLRDEVTG